METVQRLRVDSYKHMRLYSPINSENCYNKDSLIFDDLY